MWGLRAAPRAACPPRGLAALPPARPGLVPCSSRRWPAVGRAAVWSRTAAPPCTPATALPRMLCILFCSADIDDLANPLQAAVVSAICFTGGRAVPSLAAAAAPAWPPCPCFHLPGRPARHRRAAGRRHARRSRPPAAAPPPAAAAVGAGIPLLAAAWISNPDVRLGVMAAATTGECAPGWQGRAPGWAPGWAPGRAGNVRSAALERWMGSGGAGGDGGGRHRRACRPQACCAAAAGGEPSGDGVRHRSLTPAGVLLSDGRHALLLRPPARSRPVPLRLPRSLPGRSQHRPRRPARGERPPPARSLRVDTLGERPLAAGSRGGRRAKGAAAAELL